MKVIIFISISIVFLQSHSYSQTDSLLSVISRTDAVDFVVIGSQVWMSSNLNVSHYSNGIAIHEAQQNEDWYRLGLSDEAAWAYYEGDDENGRFYGKLYNWFAVNHAEGLCPAGFRMPTKSDWEQLITYLGGEYDIGFKIKSMDGWFEGGNGQNETGFDALPGGHRNGGGAFSDLGEYGYWWSITPLEEGYAYGVNLTYENNTMFRGKLGKIEGYAVRCIK